MQVRLQGFTEAEKLSTPLKVNEKQRETVRNKLKQTKKQSQPAQMVAGTLTKRPQAAGKRL